MCNVLLHYPQFVSVKNFYTFRKDGLQDTAQLTLLLFLSCFAKFVIVVESLLLSK